MKKNKYSPIKIILCGFFIIALILVCSAILNSLNNLWLDQIEVNMYESKYKSMSAILPDAESFDLQYFEPTKNVLEIYVASKQGGELVMDDGTIEELPPELLGYCVLVTVDGFTGLPIEMIVGIAPKGEVIGISYISVNETPRVGTKIKSLKFVKSIIGKTEILQVITGYPKSSNEIQAVSGATQSSKAVVEGVNEAMRAVIMLKEISQEIPIDE